MPDMDLSPFEFSTKWWRTKYCIKEGKITPVWGSEVEEYDPLTTGGNERIYLEFAGLDLEQKQGREKEVAIEDFCTRYGLLGLGHRRIRASFWETGMDSSRYRPSDKPFMPGKVQPWAYAEPVEEFMEEYRQFKWTLRAKYALETGNTNTEEQKNLIREKGKGFAVSEETLATLYCMVVNQYLDKIRQEVVVIREKGRVYNIVQWSFASLLDSFYFSLVQDFQAGRFLRQCPECRRFFIAEHQGRKYCYPKEVNGVMEPLCKDRAAKRKYKANVGLAKELKRAGKTDKEIAKIMGVSVKKVKGWLAARYEGLLEAGDNNGLGDRPGP